LPSLDRGEVPGATSDPSQRPVAAVHVGNILTSRLLQEKGGLSRIFPGQEVLDRKVRRER